MSRACSGGRQLDESAVDFAGDAVEDSDDAEPSDDDFFASADEPEELSVDVELSEPDDPSEDDELTVVLDDLEELPPPELLRLSFL